MTLLNIKSFNNKGIELVTSMMSSQEPAFPGLLDSQVAEGNVILIGDNLEDYILMKKDNVINIDIVNKFDPVPSITNTNLYPLEEEVGDNIFFSKKGKSIKFKWMFTRDGRLMKWNKILNKWQKTKF